MLRSGQHGTYQDRIPKISDVRPPVSLKKINYNRPQGPSVINPDIIFYSYKLNAYVALRLGCEPALTTASASSVSREWLPVEGILPLGFDVVLVYIADEATELALVADKEKIGCPDLIIHCKEQPTWYEKDGFEITKLNSNLKPKLGTYIISQETEPEKIIEKLAFYSSGNQDKPVDDQFEKETYIHVCLSD
jgi:hypothetical protein